MVKKFFASTFERFKKSAVPTVCSISTLVMLSVPSFAAEGDPLPTLSITTDMLTPLVEGVIANVGTILPVGLGLFAVFIGIRLIPRIISKFIGV